MKLNVYDNDVWVIFRVGNERKTEESSGWTENLDYRAICQNVYSELGTAVLPED